MLITFFSLFQRGLEFLDVTLQLDLLGIGFLFLVFCLLLIVVKVLLDGALLFLELHDLLLVLLLSLLKDEVSPLIDLLLGYNLIVSLLNRLIFRERF